MQIDRIENQKIANTEFSALSVGEKIAYINRRFADEAHQALRAEWANRVYKRAKARLAGNLMAVQSRNPDEIVFDSAPEESA
jgi:hypothetical protein